MTDATAQYHNGQTILSIVIVNWNTEVLLRNCLNSFYTASNQEFIEVIVVDNGSEDGSVAMLKTEFPRIILLQNTENRGFAAANNQGFKVAKGQYILLLNTDTLVHGDVLRESVNWINRHDDVAAMGCKVLNSDGTTQLTGSQFPSVLNLMLLTSGLWKLPWPRFLGRYQMKDWDRNSERDVEVVSGCYLLVKRDVIEEIGPLDEAFFFYGEETDWCRRMRDAGWRLVLAPVGEITHFGGGSVAKLNHRRDIMLSEAVVRLHRKHGGRIAAYIVFSILLAFNISRAAYWTLSAMLIRRDHAQERAEHFRAVVQHCRSIWPEA